MTPGRANPLHNQQISLRRALQRERRGAGWRLGNVMVPHMDDTDPRWGCSCGRCLEGDGDGIEFLGSRLSEGGSNGSVQGLDLVLSRVCVEKVRSEQCPG